MSAVEPAAEPTQAERVQVVRDAAIVLASALRDATDAGVSHAIILPQLVLVFREVFGEMPAGFQMPSIAGLSL